MTHIRSSLAGKVASPPASEDEMKAMRRRAWLSQGCVVAFLDDINDEWLRMRLKIWADEQYGPRE